MVNGQWSMVNSTMQWVTSGTNHWEAMAADNVKRIWGSMLNGSPQAWIRVGTSVYLDYLGSSTWTELRSRITTYEHSSDDISVEGVTYSFLKAEDGSALSNIDSQREDIMKTLRLWNADYQQFNAASLLSDKSQTPDNANLWYTTVKGCDASYLQSRNGTRATIGMTLEDATGIDSLRTIDNDGTERVYDLSGRRVNGNAKGIVIKNGKKRLSP